MVRELTVTAADAGDDDDRDVTLTTTGSGDVIVDNITADNKITISSAGAIREYDADGEADLTAYQLDLDAASGIGTADAIETDVSRLKAHSSTGDIIIVEKDDVDLQNILADAGSIFLEATSGEMRHTSGTIEAGASTLTLIQGKDLDLYSFTFANQENTDLMVKVTDGKFTADDTVVENGADQWKSVQVIAKDNIALQGSDDIKIGTHPGFDQTSHPFGGVVSSENGGVSIISGNGKIRTAGDSILDNIAITGNSNHFTGTGVALPYGDGVAAIVIMNKDTLKLGQDAKLTAYGTYGSVDDRSGTDFLNVIEGDKNPGNPVDVAVYLVSNTGNINVSSPVTIDPGGAMVVDAYDTVEPFGIEFLNSLAAIDWLEVCSRITPTLNYARDNHTLPYASDPGLFPGYGRYVLRGEYPDVGTGAWVLEEKEEEEKPTLPMEAIVEASSVETPTSPELGDAGQTIENTSFSDMQWLAEELGLCEGDQKGEDDSRCQEITQAYLAGAFLQSTDLRPHQAATQLRNLVGILHDTDGTCIAALGRVINEFAQPDMPPSPEQFASIAQAFAQHTNDGTHYAAAGQWLDALTEYVAILNTEIGWSTDESIAFVMGKYGTAITEAGDVSVTAFIQMHLEGFSS